MEEKIIIESESSWKKHLIIWLIVLAAVCLIGNLVYMILYTGYYYDRLEWLQENYPGTWNEYWEKDEGMYDSAIEYGISYGFRWGGWIFLVSSVGLALILIVFFMIVKQNKIIVTEKRVYGKTALGKRVDLPMDSVSAVSTAWFNGISVATSSGKISFLLIKNSKEIHVAISQLLIDRQEKKNNQPIVNTTQNTSGADDLIKYKQLLDSGVITQEEFNLKKKQILGL